MKPCQGVISISPLQGSTNKLATSTCGVATGYYIDGMKVEEEREGRWHALEVSFRQGEKTKKVIFAFLSIKGQFAIGDID